MPPQVGQAPNGLLNENSRGSISAMVKPETGQAKRDEKVMVRGASPSGASANTTSLMPSASSSAVSKESASRAAMSARTTIRSTTTSMSCLNFLSSLGTSSMA